LEERVDGTATEAAEARKQSLEANERIISQLTALEQRLSALDDQLSLFKHTIDGAAKREQEIASSLEAINGRIADDKTRVDELFPRLALGEKANKDLGVLISLCVTRIKTVNVNAAEIARRLSDLETHVRSKTERLEERLNAADKPAQSANEIEKSIDDAATKPAEEADPVAAKAGVKDCAIIEGPRILAEAAPSETKAKQEDPSVGKPAEAHAT
jgi:chromosome segregation ATPase